MITFHSLPKYPGEKAQIPPPRDPIVAMSGNGNLIAEQGLWGLCGLNDRGNVNERVWYEINANIGRSDTTLVSVSETQKEIKGNVSWITPYPNSLTVKITKASVTLISPEQQRQNWKKRLSVRRKEEKKEIKDESVVARVGCVWWLWRQTACTALVLCHHPAVFPLDPISLADHDPLTKRI